MLELVRNRQSDAEGSEEATRRLLGIPEKFGVLAIITIRYKDEEKKPYDDEIEDVSKIHYNTFSKSYTF